MIDPVYFKAYNNGTLKERITVLREKMKCCTLCPRNCKVDRLSGETGTCNTGEYAVVSSYMPHFGEEAPLVGDHGSGTIFFTHCNLHCNFCQNYDISHQGRGQKVTEREIADMMLSLQAMGCHNINFVTPTHIVPQILSALYLAIKDGLHVPLVYNSSGYDLVETLSFLDGIIDIYMPDFKFWEPEIARATCDAPDYPEIAKAALKEMHRQTGDLIIDHDGIARKGLLVRHLVMPENMAGTGKIMEYITAHISAYTYVNIMPQYRPCFRAYEHPPLNRPITREEFYSAVEMTRQAGISRLDKMKVL